MKSTGLINNFVCKNIRRIRIAKGIKVMDIADRTGIPASSYSCLEWGRYKLNLDNLFRILQVLDADISQVWPTARYPSIGVITSQHIASVLEKSERLKPREVSVEEFVEAVCRVGGVESLNRRLGRRSRKIRELQVIAAILCRDVPHITLTSLCHHMEVNISSLSHRTSRLLSLAQSDRNLHRRIESIRRHVLGQLPESAWGLVSRPLSVWEQRTQAVLD